MNYFSRLAAALFALTLLAACGSDETSTEDVATVAVSAEVDPSGGLNVSVSTTNFAVVTAADAAASEGEGFYQLLIDGQPFQRFYNDDILVAGVGTGEVDVAVVLLSANGEPYAPDGEAVTAATVIDVPEHDHSAHDHGHGEHEMGIEWAGDAPQLNLEVTPDALGGYNAVVTVDGMTLSRENANGDHVDGEGHLHLYVDGQRIARLYGTAAHIPVLPDGDAVVSVSANTNNHMPYMIDGSPIEAAVTITVES